MVAANLCAYIFHPTLGGLGGIAIASLIAGFMTSLYGFYATLTDFHIREDGQRHLTRKGKIGLAFLAIAALISAGASLAKARQDVKDDAARTAQSNALATNLQTELNRTVDINEELRLQRAKVQDLLITAEHIERPLKDMTISYELLIPIDNPELRDNSSLSLAASLTQSGTTSVLPNGCALRPLDPSAVQRFPAVASLLNSGGIFIALFSQNIAVRPKLGDNINDKTGLLSETYVDSDNNEQAKPVSFVSNTAARNIHVFVNKAAMDIDNDHHTITSISDLENSYVLLAIEPRTLNDLATALLPKERFANVVINVDDVNFSGEFTSTDWKLNGNKLPYVYGKFSKFFRVTTAASLQGIGCN